MASMKINNNNRSSSMRGGEVAAASAQRQANILASCYIVDGAGTSSSLGPSGIPEVPSSGLPSPPSSPPLAATIDTATNQLALTRKSRAPSGNGGFGGANVSSRRGGGQQTSRIRGECERFFCETLRAAFLGERSAAERVSRLTDVYHDNYNYNNNYDHDNDNDNHYHGNGTGTGTGLDGADEGAAVVNAHGQLTPPDSGSYFPPVSEQAATAHRRLSDQYRRMSISSIISAGASKSTVTAWLEIWDYAGGNGFRGFVAETPQDGAKTLFVFFDADAVVGRDLKGALVALIELADGPLGCEHMVIAVERGVVEGEQGEEGKGLLTGLRWAGFEMTTLDYWTGGRNVGSERWLFMGMEL